MPADALSEVLSSPNSLGIATLVSIRPRTQSELSEITGISVPAVLKHLRRLRDLGLVKENRVNSDLLGVRRVYTASGVLVGDYSLRDLRVVKVMEKPGGPIPEGDTASLMEELAEELMVQRRRVRDQVRRLDRMTEDLLEDQARLSRMAEMWGDEIGARLILETIFTEEDLREGEKVLTRHYGLKGGRRSIDRVMAETRRFANK